MSDYTLDERRYVRFASEWDEPKNNELDPERGNPRWFTAVYVGEYNPRTGGPDGRWDVEGLHRWFYATADLVIGAPAEAELWPPLPAPRDRSATKP